MFAIKHTIENNTVKPLKYALYCDVISSTDNYFIIKPFNTETEEERDEHTDTYCLTDVRTTKAGYRYLTYESTSNHYNYILIVWLGYSVHKVFISKLNQGYRYDTRTATIYPIPKFQQLKNAGLKQVVRNLLIRGKLYIPKASIVKLRHTDYAMQTSILAGLAWRNSCLPPTYDNASIKATQAHLFVDKLHVVKINLSHYGNLFPHGLRHLTIDIHESGKIVAIAHDRSTLTINDLSLYANGMVKHIAIKLLSINMVMEFDTDGNIEGYGLRTGTTL